MHRTTIGRAALVALALGTATIGCTPGAQIGRVASATSAPAPKAAAAAKALARANAALARHDGKAAVRYAERAVTVDPSGAEPRVLLGQAYLGVGRFASAATSFRDAMSLAPGRPQAGFGLALAEIAQGHGADAVALLPPLKGQIADTNLGLALAFAGDRTAAIATLTDAVKGGRSDARTRQNLALALALDNRWAEARAMAMQDVGADAIDAKLASFARLAQAGPADRVAAMLGVTADAADAGMPTRLALAMPAAPVAIAAASPIAQTAPASDVAPVQQGGIDAAMLPTLPAALASPPPAQFAPPRFVRAAAVAPSVSPGPLLHVGEGRYVVQLGAFARADALDAAWRQASRLSPRVAALSPVKGGIRVRGTTLIRLSVGGFGDRAQATTLCGQIRARGGACFVRAAGGDTPWQWARRDMLAPPTRES